MGIGLYTVRAILDLLGVVDYGIYNVVGGVVAMFSFVNGTLATSSQRYFSIELAKGDLNRLNKWFCLNITVFSVFILIFVVIAESIGLWFVNTQMTIPPERMSAANCVYQFSILSFCISFISIPYNALIIAHERMSAFAYISIIEALMKLGIVFVLMYISWDKLITYSILMLITSISITLSYVVYCHRKFIESKFALYWDKSEIRELLSFSGWHLFGTFSVVVRSQGINILINMFFNPAINAARAIAYQIYGAVTQFSENFLVAVKPQIYKGYAQNDYIALNKLIIRSTYLCTFLMAILVFPILANSSFVLELWLKEVPNYAIAFTQLVLINGIIDSASGPLTVSILATGRIRKYELTVATLFILNLPLSYIFLKLGAEPTTTMLVSIFISLVVFFARAYILSKKLNLPLSKYFIIFLRITFGLIVIWVSIYYTIYDTAYSFLTLVYQSIIVVILTTLVYTMFVFDKNDVKYIFSLIKSKIKK
ncbi:lipopolysaccharide biosynthesis protein [Prevotella sp. MA2016]|uniref:lipopolysaccharide biosynthesis protein n=1 Tax=Prevotella sp. MA2016 TaxID=1408310 RepID=UPI0012DC6589